eukprot:6642386-Pyramimonas_sp.AAC.1
MDFTISEAPPNPNCSQCQRRGRASFGGAHREAWRQGGGFPRRQQASTRAVLRKSTLRMVERRGVAHKTPTRRRVQENEARERESMPT